VSPKSSDEFDRYGRYLVTPADGGKPVARTRATTLGGTNDDQRNLNKWKLRTGALLRVVVKVHGMGKKR
jgi:hypothetical protein